MRFSNNTPFYPFFLFLGLLAVLQSCKVAKPVSMPTFQQPPATFATNQNPDSLGIGDQRWDDFFADAYLVDLIDVALRNNPDVLVALQRVERAQADVMVARGALLPSLNGQATASVDRYGQYTMNGVGNFDTNLSDNVEGKQQIPNPTPYYFLGLQSSWEIDLWGKLRSRREAAYARLLATEKGRQLVTTSLVSQVASNYYDLLALDSELKIIRDNIELQEVALEIVEIQKLGGRATELAVQQFEAQLLRTRSLAVERQRAITQVENRLNRLLGRYPQAIERDSSIQGQPLPDQIQAGVPSRMLLRRPDIQQAELDLTAARADIDAARAAFLPSLTLTPYVGVEAFRASVLLDPASLAAGILGGLTAPLFNKYQNRANYRRSVAAGKEALYTYQKRILTGYEEVMTELNNIDQLRSAYALKQQEVDVLGRAVTTANDLFLAGYASYLEVVTAQRNVLEAELTLIGYRRDIFMSVVNLYRALGGGWTPPATELATPAAE
ncbi:efflux transporter, outer membrane factor (OMF) lipoprotein, NodT family [Catalinimonas alkaloidigena]|uniref:Efflux transporter, outer membrane factor (OMF) lipoprotein, NodT family n=1 Tax=Catalinimonas alkaloidigena TaxID=1075417 RepID=A0A1G9RES6_9BACT|nr:TolC family protein [Catalinimonas alkaloidigena]SDM21802.1 efflux transporter, outer membrane factor (OMF) lipoprotein, NodT family [Catalinimonas alkaloidigena]